MSLIVQKFGGTSVRDANMVKNVATIVTDTYNQGNDVVVILSAQGHTTDELIDKAMELNPRPSKREMDMLMSSGEQISVALLAIAIEAMGYTAISFTGWQAGIKTDTGYSNAKIKDIDTARIQNELSKKSIVIVAGFQGINQYDDITTLGRGGSDTSAVALAAKLKADKCQIYTDVEGVYTADPRRIKGAIKLDELSYDEMLELATAGAQVLHNRSVEMAKRYNVEIEVLSSTEKKPGTIIREVTKVEKLIIKGVAKDDNVARITLFNLPDHPGAVFKIFSLLSSKNVNVDVILQSIGQNNTKDLTFSVLAKEVDLAIKVVEENKEIMGYDDYFSDANCCKVSIVGAGMETNPGIAAKMFESLADANVNIQMISTSEIKISVIIKREDGEKAVKAIHDTFYGR